MKLENIKRVEEIKSADILNLYLDKGWTLIAVANPHGDSTRYSVGWKEDVEPIYPEFIKAYRNKELPIELYGDFMTEETAYFYHSMYQEK
ncbi:MAG: hypothetical protein M3384_06320 [Acidobacteriota bacterium]|nr:hypothetical protein [Acidobacteriota bacterium]